MSSQDREWMHGLNREYANNVERLLWEMEPNFLDILAEHQAEGNVPTDLPVHNEPPTGVGSVSLTISVTRNEYADLFDAMIHVWDHGCEHGLARLSKLGGSIVNGFAEKAFDAGWFDEEEES